MRKTSKKAYMDLITHERISAGKRFPVSTRKAHNETAQRGANEQRYSRG